MPPKRFTAHQALTQILADDGDASDYGNDTGSDFEIEISVDSCHYGDSRSESDATKPMAHPALAKFMAVVMALAGSLKMKWGHPHRDQCRPLC